MKKILLPLIIISSLTIVLSGCSTTPGEKVKKQNVELYNKVIDVPISALSKEYFGKVESQILLNNDGSIYFYGNHALFLPDGVTDANWYFEDNKIYFNYKKGKWLKGYFEFKDSYSGQPEEYANNKYASMMIIHTDILADQSKKQTKYPCAIGGRNLEFLKKSRANVMWDNTDKDNYKSVLTYIKKQKEVFEKDKEIPNIKEAKSLLHDLLDKKVKRYVKKYHRSFYKYVDSTIYYKDGTKSYKFYQILRIPVLAINPKSGQKMDFNLKWKSGKFDFIINNNGVKNYFTFKPYKGNITLVRYKAGFRVNPRNWEQGFAILANSFKNFPDYDNIDTDLLDKL